MNEKTVKTLKRYADIRKLSLTDLKKSFYKTPRNKRGNILSNMLLTIRLFKKSHK